MSQLIINIKNKEVYEKILWMLKHFESKDIEIIQPEEEWRDMVMSTHSSNINDDEQLYEAYARFYNEKHID